MVTNLFGRYIEPASAEGPQDPYAPGGLRVWDDYQFRRKGKPGGGQPPLDPDRLGPPVNIVLPVINGRLFAGLDLNCTEGEWRGARPLHYDFQWFRSEIFVPFAPVNISVPVISGTETEGQTLSCPSGSWQGTAPIGYSRQWYRADAPVVPVAPGPVAPPTVTGSLMVGATLSTTDGSWSGSPPLVYHYQWKRLPSTLVGADSPSYLTVTADIDQSLVCTVTAVNVAGEASQVSNSRGPIVEAVPSEVLTADGVPLTADGEELTT